MDLPSPSFSELLERRLDRRHLIKAGAALAAVVVMPVGGALRTKDAPWASPPAKGGGPALGFTPIAPGTGDEVVVPGGYTARVLIRWGDPLRPGLTPFDVAAQTPASQQKRFGFNCDFVAFLPLPKGSRRPDQGLLWVNHEHSDEPRMFPGWTPASATKEQVDIALAAHGGSVVRVERGKDGSWRYDPSSPFNRRITATTPMVLTGPAAGHPWLRTTADPSGRRVLGTLNNCGGGVTPWGTVLTAEENFDQYFTDPGNLPAGPEKDAHLAYFDEAEDRGWQHHHPRFDLAAEPHEPFRFGWVVEVDAYDPKSVPKKRTALGRLKHEAATPVLAQDRRPVVYTGDDQVFEHVYKFVGRWPMLVGGRWANGDLLDEGTLYVARFDADGTGAWLPLEFGTGPLRTPGFASQADVLIRARQAAKALGATPMDRPEDIEVNPRTGRVYLAMTKNAKRTAGDNDAANPRPANQLGHVIELTEDGDDPGATIFRWEVFLLCGKPENLVTTLAGVDFEKDGAASTSYFAGYGDAAGLSPVAAPDNLLFDRAGRLWIGTDGQADETRLAVNDALHVVPTAGPERGRVQQFLSAAKGAEVTGPCFNPAEDALFVSIQHPGDNGTFEAPESHWPDGPPHAPRPSVVVITKDGGGPIGS